MRGLLYPCAMASLLACALTTGCKDDPEVAQLPDSGNTTDETTTNGVDGNPTTNYVSPSRAPGAIPENGLSLSDYYVDYASWGDHEKWNLANCHDPSVAYWDDGYYYMYGTDASYGNEHDKGKSHFQGKRSKDLINWGHVYGPFEADAPAWVKDTLNSIRSRMGLAAIDDIQYGYWAPVVRRVVVNGQPRLRMYYCIICDNYIGNGKYAGSHTENFDNTWGERAFIGMCESVDPANAVWEDKGMVTCSSSDKGLNYKRSSLNDWSGYFFFNAIDPTYVVTPQGEHWLIHGSWHSGFAALQINPETGMPKNKLGDPWASNATELQARYGRRVGMRTNSRWQASEAPEVIYKDGFYYLFMAYDGLDIPYNTRVVRSTSVDASDANYVDITGKSFTTGGGDCYPIVTHPYKFADSFGWVGISHCCIFQNEKTGEWFYCSQARFPANVKGNAYSNALMMGHVRKIAWCPKSPTQLDNLWPVAYPERYGNVIQDPITEQDLVGTWEHISLKYKLSTQMESTELTLKENGTMSGALNGTWSYDASTKYLTLTVGSASSIVCVDRELDWEKIPRTPTIVYTGIQNASSQPATYWGKKVN